MIGLLERLARRGVVGLVLAIGGCTAGEATPAPEAGTSSASNALEDFGPVGAFSLVNQDNEPVTATALHGKTWVASFIFTRCAGPCSQVSGTMAHLQHDVAGLPNVHLVSFTVDPNFDTPAVLKEYARRFGADPRRWSFLTGDKKALYTLIQKRFLQGVAANEGKERTPGNEVTHSTRLVLVDARGHVRAFFDGTSASELPKLETTLALLAREQP